MSDARMIAAQGMCSNSHAGSLFPWETLAEREREAWAVMADGGLDALKAAGYAVVELPKPDHIAKSPSQVDAAWSTWPDGNSDNDARWPGPYRVAVDGDEIELGGNNLLPDEAEALAAALLAAVVFARSAEAQS